MSQNQINNNPQRKETDEKTLSPESVESLLKLLILIVMKKEDAPQSIEKQDQAKINFLELLKGDSKLTDFLFGQLDNKLSKELSEDDR